MSKDVLVSLDDSEPAWNALGYALSSFPDASITVLHVLDPTDGLTYAGGMGQTFSGADVAGRRRRETTSALLDEATQLAESDGREILAVTEEGNPATVIVSYAEENGVDHILIGSHGRTGVKRLLLGSVAEAVMRRSPVPVTVVRETPSPNRGRGQPAGR